MLMKYLLNSFSHLKNRVKSFKVLNLKGIIHIKFFANLSFTFRLKKSTQRYWSNSRTTIIRVEKPILSYKGNSYLSFSSLIKRCCTK